MTQAPGSRRRRRRKGRDERGRFQRGFSGNPNGRPPKQLEVPKLLGEQLADKLWEKVARVDADGNMRTVSAYELIIERFIESIPSAKPKEIMAMLVWMQHLDVFDYMRVKVTDPEIDLFQEGHDQWFHTERVSRAVHRHYREGRHLTQPKPGVAG